LCFGNVNPPRYYPAALAAVVKRTTLPVIAACIKKVKAGPDGQPFFVYPPRFVKKFTVRRPTFSLFYRKIMLIKAHRCAAPDWQAGSIHTRIIHLHIIGTGGKEQACVTGYSTLVVSVGYINTLRFQSQTSFKSFRNKDE
jgi:hypothetical protein